MKALGIQPALRGSAESSQARCLIALKWLLDFRGPATIRARPHQKQKMSYIYSVKNQNKINFADFISYVDYGNFLVAG